MTDQLKQVADRIKGLREISDTSLETFARELGLSPETYAAYERGDIDIPVSVLHQIAGIFGVELTAILTGDYPRLRAFSVTRAGKGLRVERRKEYGYEALAYNFINKKAEPYIVSVEPPESETPIASYAHPGQEFNYVIEGTLKIVVDGHESILHEGDCIYFDASHKHGMQAMDGKRARFLAIVV